MCKASREGRVQVLSFRQLQSTTSEQVSAATHFLNILLLSLPVLALQSGKALLASTIAALVSLAFKLGTLASSFPVAGFRTCRKKHDALLNVSTTLFLPTTFGRGCILQSLCMRLSAGMPYNNV